VTSGGEPAGALAAGVVARAAVSPREVLRTALRTYREEFRRVAGTAFVVFGVIALIDAFCVVLVVDKHVSHPVGALLVSALASVTGMVGVVFYAGVLDKVVGSHLHGHPDIPMRDMWKVLPLGRLAIADLVLALGTVIGLALGVVPAMILFTFWSLVGPVITMEDQGVIASFRRSGQLVRRAFWRTVLLVTLPLQIEQGVLHAIHYAEVFDHPLVPAFLLNGLLGAAIGSLVGLIEVLMADELIAQVPLRSGLT